MNRPRLAALFSHLALALAGVCLTLAEIDFLVETVPLLCIYLFLLGLSWHSAGRWTLPTWAANLLGVAITAVAALWIVLRFRSAEVLAWLQDVPISVAIVPYLGPVIMALTLVRLYRPRAPSDFWVLQGLGLVQVALGSVLANGTLFGGLLLTYLVVAVCALAAHESQLQEARSAPTAVSHGHGWVSWAGFSLRWAVGLGLLALPLFLLTPRVDGPEDWDPLSRFLARNRPRVSHTGFSDEIALTRSGRLESDDGVAFTITATDGDGQAMRDLRPDLHWRGLVLDRYDDGLWRSDLSYSNSKHVARPPRLEDQPADVVMLEFKVPSSAGGLFLAEPVPLGAVGGSLAVWPKGNLEGFRRPQPLFFETDGTFVPFSHLIKRDYRYSQGIPKSINPERYPALRVRDNYMYRLLRVRIAGLSGITREILLRQTKRPGRFWGELHEAVRTRIANGEALPPMYWEDVARTLTNYLARSGEFSHGMASRREALDVDPNLDFLINVREGRCEQYASLLALMLRSVGVPSRVIKGYRGFDAAGDGSYQVRQSHAHAWVEVLVATEAEGKGADFDWLILDPTPETDNSRLATSPLTRLWQLQQSGQALWQTLIVGYGSREQADLWGSLTSWERWKGKIPWLGGGLVLLGVIVLARRRRWFRARPVGARSLYERLTVMLSRSIHLTARSDETPRELAARAAEALERRSGLAPSLVALPGRIVEMFYRARFGGEAPAEALLAAAAAELDVLEGALGR